jgi:hypothetical protein
MRFMLLLYERERPQPGTPEGAEMFGAVMAFHRECRERGVLVASAPLHDPETATTVRIVDDTPMNTDGPFAETTEWLGGYFILETDRDTALELAQRCPSARTGCVEVRQIMDTSS